MIPDSFDPTMMLGTAKSKGDHAAPAAPGPNARTLAESFDGAAVTAGNVEMPGADRPIAATGGYGGPPSGVDKFDGSRP